jgi:Lipocalin-like domain
MTAVMEPEIDIRSKFVGTWKLVAAEGEGPLLKRLGNRPVGMLMYDRAGNMAVQMMNENRASLPLATDGDFEAALRSYMGYFGNYELDLEERIVTHNITGSIQPGDVGIQLKRRYEFSGDQLILTTMGLLAGEPLEARLVFERWVN